MAHSFVKTVSGETDLWAYDPYAATHHGPKCTNCGLSFCIECNPEFMNTDCKQFKPAV